MHKLLMMLLMTSLVSCQHIQVLCDVSFHPEERCRCRCYNTDTLKTVDKNKCSKDWNEYFDGIPSEHPVNLDVRACDGIAGFQLEKIAKEIIPGIKDERRACQDK